ncbi:MAG: KH domain-containing protein [bacterium]|nr:KH domain-containing protein [bacterium]
MKELLEYLVRALVDDPDQVEINPVEGDRTVIFEVKVAPDDMGKVIGKQGKIANALRTVLKAAATREGKKVSVEILS